MQRGVRFVSEGLIRQTRGHGGTDPSSGRRRWLTRTVRGDRSDARRELKALAAHANIAPAVAGPTPPSLHSSISGLPTVGQLGHPPPFEISHRSSNATSSRVSVTSWWATSRRRSSMNSTRTCDLRVESMASLWRLPRYGVSTPCFMPPWLRLNAGPGYSKTWPTTQLRPEMSRPKCGHRHRHRCHSCSNS